MSLRLSPFGLSGVASSQPVQIDRVASGTQSDLILAAEIRPADHGDQQTLVDSVLKTEENLQAIGCEQSIEEVADKGYHSVATLEQCQSLGFRTYIPEPKRNTEWTWTDKTPDDQRAVMGNRQRVRRAKGKQLQKRRSEVCERTFAHVCETGGMRRSWLEGLTEVTKRYLIATAAHNLGRVMWKLLGVGKPRRPQGRDAATWAAFAAVWAALHWLLRSQTDRAEQPDGFVRPGAAAAGLAG